MISWPSLINITAPNFHVHTVGHIITSALPYIYGLAGFALLIYLIFGGYQILTSQGDPKKLAMGQQRLTQAIVGFIIIFAAYWIVQIAARVLDLQKIRDIFG